MDREYLQYLLSLINLLRMAYYLYFRQQSFKVDVSHRKVYQGASGRYFVEIFTRIYSKERIRICSHTFTEQGVEIINQFKDPKKLSEPGELELLLEPWSPLNKTLSFSCKLDPSQTKIYLGFYDCVSDSEIYRTSSHLPKLA